MNLANTGNLCQSGSTMQLSDNLIWFAWRLGTAALRRGHVSIGLKRIMYPVGYWRYPVFRYIQQCVAECQAPRILDIGSPKLLALWLAAERACDVWATDYQDRAIFEMWGMYYRDLMGDRDAAALERLRAELQDARHLTYPDETFDLVYSVSVLEHIPGDGDSVAMREIARVLRPGGTAIIEVPFAVQGGDSFVRRDVYGTLYDGVPIFYQRHYDLETAQRRLVEPSGLRLVDSRILGERRPFERWWNRLPEFVKASVYWLEWIAAVTNLADMGNLMRNHPESCRKIAMDVTLALEKGPKAPPEREGQVLFSV